MTKYTTDNRKLFAIADSIMLSLFNAGFLDNKGKGNAKSIIFNGLQANHRGLNDAIQPTDNKTNQGKTPATALQDNNEFKSALSVLDSPKHARAWLLVQLKTAVEAGNAAAAKEIRDLLGIESAEQDIRIETVDFSAVESTYHEVLAEGSGAESSDSEVASSPAVESHDGTEVQHSSSAGESGGSI